MTEPAYTVRCDGCECDRTIGREPSIALALLIAKDNGWRRWMRWVGMRDVFIDACPRCADIWPGLKKDLVQ